MKKRMLSLMLVFSILSTLIVTLPVTVSAATSGTCGDNLTWTLDDEGTLTISGTGAMYNWTYFSPSPWMDSARDKITSIVINEGVTTIGDYAFRNFYRLTSVTIPESVKSIGDDAFVSCNQLAEVNIPNGVTNIGEYAFSGCRLTNVVIPDSVVVIDDHVFSSTNLTSVIIGPNVTEISNSAFYFCEKLKSITVSEKNDSYSSENGILFNKSKTSLVCYPLAKDDTTYVIPNSVVTIGDNAFAHCNNLTSVTMSDNVITIGEKAFENCDNLTSVTIPDGVKIIKSNAFEYCTELTNVKIGQNVTEISNSAFYVCKKLKSITVSEKNDSYSSENGILFNKSKTSLVCYPSAKDDTTYVIPNSVVTIGNNAFAHCDNLTSVTMSDNVITIGNKAFEDCSSLKYVRTSKNITNIGYSAFSYCKSLLSITIPHGVESIFNYTFFYCESLSNIVIPDSVVDINQYAFYDCSSLVNVYYSGRKADWDKIDISSMNDPLLNAKIHYQGIALSSTYITALPYTCQSIYVYKGDGVTPYDKSFKVTSSKPEIVSSSRKGNEIILSFNSLGSATITVEAIDGSGAKETCSITVVEKFEDEEATQDRDLLERLALCQIVYSHKLSGYDTVSELLESEGKLFEKDYDNTMFYLSNSEIAWKDFLKIYINDYKIKMLKDDPSTGFFAAAFESPEGDIIIVYRGSEGNHEWLGVFMVWDENEVDWWGADLPMFLGIKTSQFSQALNFYDDVKREYGSQNIRLTGHSLGGALSSYVALNKKVYTDNINGATGLIYNRNLLIDEKQYPVNYGGFDKYITENFSVHDDLANNVVTRLRNFGEFNYNEYADSTTKNKKDKFDYHSISSVLDYINGSFVITEKVNEHIAEPDIRYGVRYIGTSEDNTYIAPITKKNYPESLPGSNQPAYKELPVAPPNHYVLAGDGDDNITLPEGGNDTLIGNAGNDTLNGGAGNDIYVYGGDFGNDTIIDPSGKDKIVFTDRTLSEITISGNKITCGSNTIEISTKSKRTADFTVVDKDKNTQPIEFSKVSLYSLRRIVTADTTKGIKIFGNAEVEIYDAAEELMETLYINEETEASVEYKDYGMVTYSPQAIGLTLPPEGYIVKIKSDESVSAWAVSDADNPAVAKQTFVENQDLSDGSMIVINTGEMVEEQLSVKLVNGDEEQDVYSEVPENFTITADKTAIKTGEAITMSVPETFADSVIWECTNNNVIISKNEDLSVSVIGYTPGEETVRAYLPNDELYSAEFSFEITEDSSPSVVVSSKEEIYDGTEIATDSVVFDVTMADGYDTIVFDTFSPYSQIEDTNTFVVNSVGDHVVNIYCKNSETGAMTDAFTFEFEQDSEAPTISGAENEAVYYTDRVIEVSDTALDTIYINDELCEEETFIISEVGTYNITATDTAGNTTEISFEIKSMPSVSDISLSDAETVSQIRSNFEEIKYSLSEERMNELETEISALETAINDMHLIKISDFDITHSEEKFIADIDFEYVKKICIAELSVYDENSNLILSTSADVAENAGLISIEAPFVGDDKTYYITVKFLDDNQNELRESIKGSVLASKKVYSYNGFKYKLTDNKAEIVGYENAGSTVYLPIKLNNYDVASIASKAFEGKSTITAVVIPNTIESIAKDAFEGCINLKTINYIGSSEEWALYGLSASDINGANVVCNYSSMLIRASSVQTLYEKEILTLNISFLNNYVDSVLSVRIRDNQTNEIVKNFSYNVAKGTEEFTTEIPFIADDKSYTTLIQFTESLSGKILLGSTKQFVASMEKITIGDYNCGISNGAIAILGYNGEESSINIPAELNGMPVYKLGSNVFKGKSVKSITLPNTIRTINSASFNSCYTLESIDVSNENETFCSVDGVFFNKNKTILLRYPTAKKGEIYEIPDTVGTIYNMAFADNKNIKKIIIPEGVTGIRNNAFRGTNIKSLDIPASLNGVQGQSFSYCYSLESINVHKDNATFSSLDGVLYNKAKTFLYQYPIGRNNMYFDVPEGVLRIGNNAFLSSKLKSILLPDTITAINDGAFSNCTELTSVIYCGIEEKWADIAMTDTVKESLKNVELIYNHNDETKVYAEVVNCVYEPNKVIANVDLNYVSANCKAILAVYTPDGKMINLSSESITTEDSECELSVPVNINCKGYSYKILFWRDYALLEPQTKALEGLIK